MSSEISIWITERSCSDFELVNIPTRRTRQAPLHRKTRVDLDVKMLKESSVLYMALLEHEVSIGLIKDCCRQVLKVLRTSAHTRLASYRKGCDRLPRPSGAAKPRNTTSFAAAPLSDDLWLSKVLE